MKPYASVTHSNPWKRSNPPKKGYNKTINKVAYTEDPGKEKSRPKTAGIWRHPTHYLSKPQPTITNNFKNVNSQFAFIYK